MFAQVLYLLPKIFGAGVCLYALWMFWRGLSLKEHREGHKAPPNRFFSFFQNS